MLLKRRSTGLTPQTKWVGSDREGYRGTSTIREMLPPPRTSLGP